MKRPPQGSLAHEASCSGHSSEHAWAATRSVVIPVGAIDGRRGMGQSGLVARAVGSRVDGTLSLRRRFWARCRFTGGLELLSLLGVLFVGLIANDLAHGRSSRSDGWVGDAGVAVFLVGSIAVRVAVATEYVRADERGVHWRSLFRGSFVPWDRVASIDVGRMFLFGEKRPAPVIVLHTADGRVKRLRASAWCGDARSWVVEVLQIRATTGEGHPSDSGGLVLSGFAAEPFGGRAPDWKPDDEFGDIDAAIVVARRWLIEQPDGVVEVVRMNRGVGEVVRVVTAAGVERIDKL